MKKNINLRDALDTTFQISKLLKFSPCRDAIFERLKAEIAPGTPGFRTLPNKVDSDGIFTGGCTPSNTVVGVN